MPPAAAIAAVAALRRIAAACRAGERLAPEDGELLDQALALYLAKAADGMSLGAAFGVETRQGEPSWWSLERHSARYAAIRAAATRLAGGAIELDAELKRYVATDWRRDQRLDQLPAEFDGGLRALLFQIAKAGRIPKLRRLRQIAG